MKPVTLLIEDVILHPDYNPPAMTLYCSYKVPPVDVLKAVVDFDAHYQPCGSHFEPAGMTDRADTSVTLPMDESVKPGMSITVTLSE